MKTLNRNFVIVAAMFLALNPGTHTVSGQSGEKKARKITITGVVMDANMRPVEGARIFVDQVFTNVITNSKGIYRLRVSPSIKQISAFSALHGVQKLEIKSDMTAEGYSGINIILTNINALNGAPVQEEKTAEPGKEEEMINIGYGELSRKNVNTEINKVTSQHHYQNYSNMYDLLRGEVPGVEVFEKTIRIREAFSFNLSTEPLLVVDGMIIPSLDDINPVDVRSVEVLKGAAASVYGARGANGVILITTLKGSEKK